MATPSYFDDVLLENQVLPDGRNVIVHTKQDVFVTGELGEDVTIITTGNRNIGINRNTHGEPVEYTNMVLMACSDTVEELKALGVNTRYAEEIDAQLERG